MIQSLAESQVGDELDCSPYLCPRTGAGLRSAGGRLRADEGGSQFAVHRGIPQFLRFAPAESADETAKLRRLNERSRQVGWRTALEEAYRESPEQIRYNTDPLRSKFLDLVPLTNKSVVLEVGSALGHITTALARRAKAVHALEVVPEQAEFTAERCRQESFTNVAVACGGDDCLLPYATAFFDAMILNLVFEWSANRLHDEPFIDGQRRMLSEALRVLKPGGQLFLATKNRYALSYLLGKHDEHVGGIRFGNALPRWLMEWQLRRRGKRRPAGLLHSHNGLQRLLQSAGFVAPRSFWAAPEMRYPSEYIPTDAESIRAARRRGDFSQGQFRSTSLLMRLVSAPLVKHVTPGLLFIAEKPC